MDLIGFNFSTKERYLKMNDNIISVNFNKKSTFTLNDDETLNYTDINSTNIDPVVADFVPTTRAAWVNHLFKNLEPDDFYDFMSAVRSPEDFENVDVVVKDMVYIYFGLPE
jgi:hypothetical protein